MPVLQGAVWYNSRMKEGLVHLTMFRGFWADKDEILWSEFQFYCTRMLKTLTTGAKTGGKLYSFQNKFKMNERYIN